MFQILLVEPHRKLQKRLATQLETAGYSPICVCSSDAALEMILHMQIDMVILSQSSPQTSLLPLIPQLREQGFSRPILFLYDPQGSAKDSLRLGADDAIPYSTDSEELHLRIHVLLRRAQLQNRQILQFGSVTLRYKQLSISRGKELLFLPRKEFLLLYFLLSYPGQIFTREQLLEEVWGPDSNSISTTVNVHINRLRTHFKNWSEFEIITVRGIGYKAVIHANTNP